MDLDKIVDDIREAVSKCNKARLKVESSERVILDVPISLGLIGVLLSPTVGIVSISAALLSKNTIMIVNENGQVVYSTSRLEK